MLLDVNDLAVDLHTFFKLSAARIEDFRVIQLDLELEELMFVRHVPTRWLTFGNAVKRILNQWPAVCDYKALQLKPSTLLEKRVDSGLKIIPWGRNLLHRVGIFQPNTYRVGNIRWGRKFIPFKWLMLTAVYNVPYRYVKKLKSTAPQW